jgi:antitoxin MazE
MPPAAHHAARQLVDKDREPHVETAVTLQFAEQDVYLLDIHVENELPVQVTVTKWGNSLGLRVPRDVAARVGLTEGARVDIEASDDGRIIVTRSRRRFTLEELLAGMTRDREHPLDDDGPVGDEKI